MSAFILSAELGYRNFMSVFIFLSGVISSAQSCAKTVLVLLDPRYASLGVSVPNSPLSRYVTAEKRWDRTCLQPLLKISQKTVSWYLDTVILYVPATLPPLVSCIVFCTCLVSVHKCCTQKEKIVSVLDSFWVFSRKTSHVEDYHKSSWRWVIWGIFI